MSHLSHIADTRLWDKGFKGAVLQLTAGVSIDNGSRPICADDSVGMVLKGTMDFRDVASMSKTCESYDFWRNASAQTRQSSEDSGDLF